MLQITVGRIVPDLAPSSSVYVITGERHVEMVREQLPDISRQHVVGEPVGRDSAPAIGVMAALIEQELGPDPIMIVLASDHDIQNVEGFRELLRAAIKTADEGYLVTLGIQPTSADTGFGYIQRGELLSSGDVPVFRVASFREKPDSATAEEYVASSSYFWNAGMFIARVGTFRQLYKQFLPEMEPHLNELVAEAGTARQDVTFARIFPQLPKISFDFAIAEKADKVAVIPAAIGWSDVGSWARLAEILDEQSDERHNVLFGNDNHHLIDSHRSLIYSPEKMVALIGLEDVVIVDTPEALLIAAKDRVEDVKRIVEMLEKQGRHDLL